MQHGLVVRNPHSDVVELWCYAMSTVGNQAGTSSKGQRVGEVSLLVQISLLNVLSSSSTSRSCATLPPKFGGAFSMLHVKPKLSTLVPEVVSSYRS